MEATAILATNVTINGEEWPRKGATCLLRRCRATGPNWGADVGVVAPGVGAIAPAPPAQPHWATPAVVVAVVVAEAIVVAALIAEVSFPRSRTT